LPDGAWEHVFGPLRGRRVGYVPLPGNAGDHLIEAGTFALLARFGVDWSVGADPDADVLLVAGGGSMGSPEYALCREARLAALAAGPPVWVLPQSWRGRDPEADAGRYARLFARDRPSLAHAPAGTELAPDLALALDRLPESAAEEGPGTWLRRDCEALFADAPSLGDPVEGCRDGWHYLERAGRHSEVLSDRLHFAVAALLCGREATLLPGNYSKNRGVWEAWLKDIDCKWADTPP
jgi:exopolysaccharide biosynthesis predicted pyruvyltransferase EpsI